MHAQLHIVLMPTIEDMVTFTALMKNFSTTFSAILR